MTKRKRWAVVGTGATCLLVAACVCLHFLPPYELPDKARYDRIEMGMTLQQAEEVMGGRPQIVGGAGAVEWVTETGKVMVQLQDGRVAAKGISFRPPTVLDRLRHWLGL